MSRRPHRSDRQAAAIYLATALLIIFAVLYGTAGITVAVLATR